MSPRARGVAISCGGLVALIGLLSLCEGWFGWRLGIDELFVRDPLTAVDAFPGRMAPATAVGFLLLGMSLVLLDVEYLGHRPAGMSLLLVFLIGLLGVLGYVYGASAFHRLASYGSVAFQTACLFVVLGLGALFARSDRGFMGVVTSPHGGGAMARRILPVAAVLPFAVGWVRLQMLYAGWFGTEFGLALFATSNIVTFSILVWLSARKLNSFDQIRQKAEGSLRLAHAELEERVLRRTGEVAEAQKFLREVLDAATGVAIVAGDANGLITLFNSGAERMLGYTAEEMIGKETPLFFTANPK